MRRSQVWRVVDRLYVEIETALWAGLAAFVIFFCALILPYVPANVAKAQAAQALELTEENQQLLREVGHETRHAGAYRLHHRPAAAPQRHRTAPRRRDNVLSGCAQRYGVTPRL